MDINEMTETEKEEYKNDAASTHLSNNIDYGAYVEGEE